MALKNLRVVFLCTVGSKIIRAIEIICVKKLTPTMQFSGINIYQVMIFGFYTVDNKHEMIKIGH